MADDTKSGAAGEHRDSVSKLARQIEGLPPLALDVLTELLGRDDRGEREELLEELDLRRSLARHAGRGGSFVVLALGLGIVVSALLRLEILAQPHLGFGGLGVLLLFLGMRGWYRAGEIRKRVEYITTKIANDDLDDAIDLLVRPQRGRRGAGRRR